MYNVASYWENRLAKETSLKGVGHQSFGQYYNSWLYLRKKKVLLSILKEEQVKNKKVLDVGVGIGFFISIYENLGANIAGLDISPTAIDYVEKKYPNHSFWLADFSQNLSIEFPDYDIVNAWDVIYHQVEEKYFYTFLENIASICIKGGILILTDTFLQKEKEFSPSKHVKFRSLTAYSSQMESLGFQIEGLFPLYTFLNRKYSLMPRSKKVYDGLAPLFYGLDSFLCTKYNANLLVSKWRKVV